MALTSGKTTLARLQAMRADILARIAEHDPGLVDELNTVDAAIAGLASGTTGTTYTKLSGPKKNIIACLKNSGRRMTRREIFDELRRGGYPMANVVTTERLLDDAIDYHVSRGTLIEARDGGIELPHGHHK